jgi:purine catabolism regulator
VKLEEALQITSLKRATLAAGTGGLSREVRWVHIVDMPDVVSWVRPDQLLLTTGYAWPRDESSQRQLLRLLAEQNLAGVGLAVPRFFEHFPPAFCDEAERLNLPLLEIPWEIPFAQITQELHGALLIEQSRVIEQSERIHRSLTRAALEASSLQDIADTLGKLINHAVTFEDQEGRILGAYTIPGTEDRVRRETLERGVTPPDVLDYLEQSGLLNAIDDAGSPQRIPPNPDIGFVGRIVCPIRLKGETVGRVWIIEGSAPLSELDLRAAEHAAVVAALQIAQQRTIASVEARVGYSFLTTILEGRFEATPQSLERAQIHGLVLDGSYRVGIFVMEDALPLSHGALLTRENIADQLRHHLLRMGFAPLISVSLNQIQFLLPDGADAHLLWDFLSRPEMAFGLSRAYPGVDGIRQAYLEMQGMLPHLRPNAFLRYEDLLLPRVLMGAPDAQRAFVEEVFGPLKQHRSGDVLKRTLIAFAEHGFHLNHTAQALHIHPKSLRYRITLVAELCELDFHDADTRFRVQLAAQLLRLRE